MRVTNFKFGRVLVDTQQVVNIFNISTHEDDFIRKLHDIFEIENGIENEYYCEEDIEVLIFDIQSKGSKLYKNLRLQKIHGIHGIIPVNM